MDFEHILDRKVSRKEFILMVGSMVLAIVGLKQLATKFKAPQKGYGSSPYGI